MGQLYINNRAVTPIITKTKEVAKTKFGATVDTFLGDVDANGNYVAPSGPVEVNMTGLKSIGRESMRYVFAGSSTKRFIANDLESIGNDGFWHCFINSKIEQASFDGIEEINGGNVFGSCFANCYEFTYLSFKKLKRIKGPGVFQYVIQNSPALTLTYDEMFPSLEEVSGNSAFNTGRQYKENEAITFSKVKKITGDTSSAYSSVFGTFYTKNTVWNFPSATEFTGYIWNMSTSYPGEIHFAAANREAIEACEGYDYKWGFAGAAIYFDL